MNYIKEFHTKQFLLSRPEIACELAISDEAFALSEISQDMDILLLKNKYGSTVGHLLAINQPSWSNTLAVENLSILSLRDKQGFAIAHALAKFQPNWLNSDASQKLNVLSLCDANHTTVAHILAKAQPNWVESNAANDLNVLKMTDKSNVSVAHILSASQPNWINTIPASNYEILSLKDNYGATVAHSLAKYQRDWMYTSKASDLNVLFLKDFRGSTVAHCLAAFNPNWASSTEAQNFRVLSETDINNFSVAHMLATHQLSWLSTEAARSKLILNLSDKNGTSVAHTAIETYISKLSDPKNNFELKYAEDWFLNNVINDVDLLKLQTNSGLPLAYRLIKEEFFLKFPVLLSKDILCLSRWKSSKILAEVLIDEHSTKHGFTFENVVVDLIKQGAAYRHSSAPDYSVFSNIFEKVKILIDDSLNVLVAFKYAQALYSSVYHASQLVDSSRTHDWQQLLGRCEVILRDFLNNEVVASSNEETTEYHCEPSHKLICKIKAETNLKAIRSNEEVIALDTCSERQALHLY